MTWQRPDGRKYNELRPHSWQLNFTSFATSSVLVTAGQTKVLCNVTIEEGVPKFLEGKGQGWLTAEYRLLPGSTPQRQKRELMQLSGRTQEIQRLIGRSLRACLDLKILGERTITIDADVLQADAGTRTTSINGAFVAVADAVNKLLTAGKLERSPLIHQVAAISVGLLENSAYLDLNYPEDVAADIDFNVVMTENMQLIELQGTAEAGSFSRQQLNELLDLATGGIEEILHLQRQVINIQV
jgi:ribonuclease PH